MNVLKLKLIPFTHYMQQRSTGLCERCMSIDLRSCFTSSCLKKNQKGVQWSAYLPHRPWPYQI